MLTAVDICLHNHQLNEVNTPSSYNKSYKNCQQYDFCNTILTNNNNNNTKFVKRRVAVASEALINKINKFLVPNVIKTDCCTTQKQNNCKNQHRQFSV